jgi:PAS domain S-box-containing protein
VFSALAGAIYARQARARLNRIFVSLCALMALMALAQAMIATARDAAAAELWMRIGMAAWPFSMAVMYVFSLVYSKARSVLRRRALITAIYLLALAVSVMNLLMPIPVRVSFDASGPYPSRPVMDSLPLLASAVWGTALSLMTAFRLVRYRLRVRERIARRQATFVAIGILLPVLTGILTQAVLPGLGIRIPALADLSGAVLALFVSFAIWRYELFVLDPAQESGRMLSLMREAVLLLDAAGIVTYANPAARRFWDLPLEDIIGRPVAAVCGPGFSEAGGMERLLVDGSAMEITWRSAGGASVFALVSGTALRDRRGDAKGALLVATDISGQKKLEGMLQQSRQTLRTLVDNNPAKIVLVDAHGIIQVANEPTAQHFNDSTSSLTGRDVFSLFGDDIAADRKERLGQVVASGVPLQYTEIRGGRHWEHRLTPVTDEEGRVTSVSILSLDVTERVEAERMRERLIGELSDALAKVKTLSGLIPICAHCKRIRNDAGYWQQVEQYLAEHTGADFTHGLCSDCLHELYPEYAQDIEDEDRV